MAIPVMINILNLGALVLVDLCGWDSAETLLPWTCCPLEGGRGRSRNGDSFCLIFGQPLTMSKLTIWNCAFSLFLLICNGWKAKKKKKKCRRVNSLNYSFFPFYVAHACTARGKFHLCQPKKVVNAQCWRKLRANRYKLKMSFNFV